MNRTDFDGDAAWAFIGALYGRGAVKDWCLEWQDAHDLDVSFFLTLLWLEAAHGCCVGPADVRRLDAAVADWRAAVVKPIRSARRFARAADHKDVREKLSAAELAAERGIVDTLLGALTQPLACIEDGGAAAYFSQCSGGVPSAQDRRRLSAIADHARALANNSA